MPDLSRQEHTRIRRTSMNLDTDLVAQARDLLGTNGTTDTIHRALSEVVLRERRKRAAALRFDDLTPEALDELRRTRT
jgi:Arc/MetJ family transcription regulator